MSQPKPGDTFIMGSTTIMVVRALPAPRCMGAEKLDDGSLGPMKEVNYLYATGHSWPLFSTRKITGRDPVMVERDQ